MHVLLSLVLVCFSCRLTTASWSSAHRNQILEIHNDYRKGTEEACSMNMMTYDVELEKEAKTWAKKCVFKHQNKERGENIAWYTKYTAESELIEMMAKMWYDEIKDYTYGSYSCGAACHYTQMVWSKSTKLGCYANHCDRLQRGGRNAYYLVCFYSPPGNIDGENPYETRCNNNNININKNNNNNENNENESNYNDNNNNNNNNDDNSNNIDWDNSDQWEGREHQLEQELTNKIGNIMWNRWDNGDGRVSYKITWG